MYTAPATGAVSSAWSPPTPGAALASPTAPTARVEPSADSATLAPKTSPTSVLEALMYARWTSRRRAAFASAAGSLAATESLAVTGSLASSGAPHAALKPTPSHANIQIRNCMTELLLDKIFSRGEQAVCQRDRLGLAGAEQKIPRAGVDSIRPS